MTFNTFFKACSYCLISSGFLAIAAAGGVKPTALVLFSAVLVTSWFIDTKALRRRFPVWMVKSAAISYAPFCLIDYYFLSRSPLAAVFHLLFYMAAIKLLTLSKDRDYVVLYLISFVELLAASTFAANMIFIFSFSLFLFSGIATLILFEIRLSGRKMQREAKTQSLMLPKELQGSGMEHFSHFPAGLLCTTTAGIMILIMAGAVPLFFLLPRAGLNAQRQPSGKTKWTSGFSEKVELGQLGLIKKSDAIVMRVKTERSSLPADLKLRGMALDYFDGRSWFRANLSRHPAPIEGRYYKLQQYAQGTNLINQTFFVEALSTDVVFAANKALAISREVGLLSNDAAGNLYASRNMMDKLKYSAISNLVIPDISKISDASPIPPEVLKIYTQTPPLDPGIPELAAEITKNSSSKYEKAQALERYLRGNYRYSLDLREFSNRKDLLAAFLFDVQKGHCEYFASAMTIMLREIGIPARIVNGFRLGELNELNNSWTVRNYDAHSWVEAYFPPYGWLEFDPTPPDFAPRQAAFIRIFSNITDAVDLWWWENIVNYNPEKQYRTIDYFFASVSSLRQSLNKLTSAGIEKGKALAATLKYQKPTSSSLVEYTKWLPLLVIAILFIVRPTRKFIVGAFRRKLYHGNSQAIAIVFYEEALDMLRQRGFNRSTGQTPLEFAQSLEIHPAGRPFRSLTDLYYSVRFGSAGLQFQQSEGEALLRQLRLSLKNKGVS